MSSVSRLTHDSNVFIKIYPIIYFVKDLKSKEVVLKENVFKVYLVLFKIVNLTCLPI